jgi:hypothetical protein
MVASESRIAEKDHDSQVDATPGDAPEDRRHMATALAGHAPVIGARATATWLG